MKFYYITFKTKYSMEKITKEQLQKLHVMLNQLGLMDEKSNMVYSVSNGRVTSSKELTKDEGRLMIEYLSKVDGSEKMRKKIFALAYQSKIIWGDTAEDKKMNAIKLNQFLNIKGAVKKDLNKMNSR